MLEAAFAIRMKSSGGSWPLSGVGTPGFVMAVLSSCVLVTRLLRNHILLLWLCAHNLDAAALCAQVTRPPRGCRLRAWAHPTAARQTSMEMAALSPLAPPSCARLLTRWTAPLSAPATTAPSTRRRPSMWAAMWTATATAVALTRAQQRWVAAASRFIVLHGAVNAARNTA